MKRALKTAAIAVTLAGIAIGPPSSYANARLDVHTASQTSDANRPHDWRQEQCRFATRDGQRGWSPDEIRATLRCAERKWSGDLGLGFRIVGCESGFHAEAQNGSSSAGGVWQVIDSTWQSWVGSASSLVERWSLKTEKRNGRTNAVLGWRVFSPSNTGPWEASRHCWG